MKTANRLFLVALALISLSVIGPKAQAVMPPPDGGYPGFNTAEGQKALFNLSTGAGNTAIGWFSLFSNADWQLQHRCWRGVASFQHRRRKYGLWHSGAFKQHHRQ